MEEKHLTRAILIGADTGEYDAESSMDELAELAQTAGASLISPGWLAPISITAIS